MAQELKAFKLGSVELGEYWAYDAEEVDAVLAEKDAFIKTLGEGQAELACEIERLKTKLEDVQASTNAEIRRLNRKYWDDKADEAAKMKRLIYDGEIIYRDEYCNEKDWRIMYKVWEDEETKCRAKAEEHK